MTAIPFPLSSAPGLHPQEAAGRLINCFAEPLGEEARSKFAIRRAPGLTLFGTSGGTGYRGGQLVGSTFYAAWGTRVERYTSAGGAGVLVGTLPGTAKSFWARNNKATPDVVVVAPGDGAFTVTAGAVTAYADLDLPAPNSVCFLLGFFIFSIGDGRMFASDVNAVTVNALNFATAESKPDTLYRVIPLGNGYLLAAGSNSMEVWGGTVNATGFPFSYSYTIARGIVGPSAIAGHEDGFGKGIVFVGDDNAVHYLTGSSPEKISPPDLDRLIESVADKTTIECMAFVAGGHACVAVQCPAWSWVFNLNNLKWYERESYLITRWRATQAHYAFGKWLVGDTTSGSIYSIDRAAKKEGTNPLRARVESGPVHAFPVGQVCAQAIFNVTTGVGVATGVDPIETNPSIEISWTTDGGVNWGRPLVRKLGRQNETRGKISVGPCGLATSKGHRWRLDISDPVDFSIMGGEMNAMLMAA